MDIVITKDILKMLDISSFCFHHVNGDIPLEPVIISPDSFLCIINSAQASDISLNESSILYYRMNGSQCILNILVSEILHNDGMELLRLDFNLVDLPIMLQQKLSTLFTVSEVVQKRKEDRLMVTEEIPLKRDVILISENQKNASLRDISFSGLRCYVSHTDKYYPGQKLVVNLSFKNPTEIISVLGIVVRYSSLYENSISEVAIQLCLTNFNYQTRIAEIL